MTGVQFDPDSHSYTRRGRLVPGVTELLKPVSGYYGASAEQGRALGTYVHEACALDDLDDLDEDSIAPEVFGFLTSWRKWRESLPPHRFTLIEQQVYAPQSNYAGTLDRLMVTEEEVAVVEIKSGAAQPEHQLQTYAYARALKESGDITVLEPRGILVYLDRDGELPSVNRFSLKDEEYYTNLAALIRVWHLRKEYGR